MRTDTHTGMYHQLTATLASQTQTERERERERKRKPHRQRQTERSVYYVFLIFETTNFNNNNFERSLFFHCLFNNGSSILLKICILFLSQFVTTQPEKTFEPHLSCEITRQQPRSSISNNFPSPS